MNKHETKILKKLYKNSDKHGRGDLFIEEISQLTDFTISLVKDAIISLRKLEAILIDPAYNIDDLDKKLSFIILLNRPVCSFLQENKKGDKCV